MGKLGKDLGRAFQDKKETAWSKAWEKANRGKPSEEAMSEWEQVSQAPTTANTKVTDRGVMPNRSAFSPGELPKVNLPAVNKIMENKDDKKRPTYIDVEIFFHLGIQP